MPPWCGAKSELIDICQLFDIHKIMKAATFDTLEFAKRLRQADFTEKQAETLAFAVAEVVESRLATKEDLARLQHDLEEKIARLQHDLEEKTARLQHNLEEKIATLQRDMKEMELQLEEKISLTELRLKHDLTLRLGGMLAAAVAIVAALVKLL